jgi:hypothetical protein
VLSYDRGSPQQLLGAIIEHRFVIPRGSPDEVLTRVVRMPDQPWQRILQRGMCNSLRASRKRLHL